MNKVSFEKLLVGSTAAGQEIFIHTFTVNSGKPGKTVWVQGGIHGGEVTLPIFTKLFAHIKKNLLSGKVILVPFCNPLAWEQHAYCYTVGKFSMATGKDFNRSFGKKVFSLTDRNMSVLAEEMKKADFVFDLHTAHESIPFGIVNKKEYLKYAATAGLPYTYYCPQSSAYDGTTDDFATNLNIPNLVIECGSHDAVNQKDIKNIFAGISAVLQEMGMLKEKTEVQKDCFYYTAPVKLITEHAGIVEYVKMPGEKFEEGDILYTVYSPDLRKSNFVFKAPFAGVVLKYQKKHIFSQYDEVVEVIKKDDLKKI